MKERTRPTTGATSTAADKPATVEGRVAASPNFPAILAEMRAALAARRNAPPSPPPCGPCIAYRRHLLSEAQWLKVGCEHAIEGQP